MANQNGRPIAPARKLVAAVLGTIAVFVMVFGLGLSSWAIVVLGLAMLALSITLGMVNVVRRGARAWVSGTAQVKAVSEAPASSAYGRAELQIVVVAPGLPVTEVLVRDPRVPVDKWPRLGETLPITVDVDDMRRVRIDWVNAPDRGDPPPPGASFADPGYPATVPYPDPLDEYDDDLLGTPEPPPWAAGAQRKRTFDEPPPPPPPVGPPPTDPDLVVVHDTPAGLVVEGTLVGQDDIPPPPLPRRAGSGPIPAPSRPAPSRPSPSSPSPSSPSQSPPAQSRPAEPSRAAGMPPSPHPRGSSATATATAGTATATVDPEPSSVHEAAVPHAEEPSPVARQRRPSDEPQAAAWASAPETDTAAATTPPETPNTTATPQETDNTAAAAPERDTPAATAPLKTDTPAASNPAADVPAATAPATEEPPAGAPETDHEIDLPLDGDPEPAPETTPAARSAVTHGLVAPPPADVPHFVAPGRETPPEPVITGVDAAPATTAADAAPATTAAASAPATTAGDAAPATTAADAAPATTAADAAPATTAARGPWADLGAGYEPDDRAGDVITAYPSARPGPAAAIHGVGLTVLVTNLGSSVEFYRDTLGFFEIDSGAGNAVLASGDTRLVLRTVTDLSAAGRLIYLNLEVGDVEAVYRELTAKGVVFAHEPMVVNHGAKLELWSATFHDPDGHNIAITQWRATR